MKKMLLVAVAMVSASAFAGGKLTVRSDYRNHMEFTAQNGTTKVPAMSVMNPALGLLSFDGKLGDSSTYKGQLNLITLNKAGTGGVEYLYLTKAMGDWSFSAGKIEVNSGGFEAARVIAGDSYMDSLASTGKCSTCTTTNGTELLGNNSGAEAAYTMGDHRFAFQATNQTGGPGSDTTNKRHNMIVNYTGSMMDKMLGLNIGYASGSTNTATTETNGTYMNLGVSLALGFADMTFDYLSNSVKGTATGDKADSINSMVVEIRKSMGSWTPIAKIESSEYKKSEDAANTSSFKRTGVSLAAEFMPKAGEDFRYHVAYNTWTDKYGFTGASDVKPAQLVAGFKYNGDLWK